MPKTKLIYPLHEFHQKSTQIFLSYRSNKQADRRTNASESSTPAKRGGGSNSKGLFTRRGAVRTRADTRAMWRSSLFSVSSITTDTRVTTCRYACVRADARVSALVWTPLKMTVFVFITAFSGQRLRYCYTIIGLRPQTPEITSAKEDMFSSLFVCLLATLRFAQKLPNGFA